MGGINKVFVLGNLGADPDVRYTPGGEPVANLRLATSKAWRDKATGKRKEKTEWHRVVLFRQLAATAEKYLHKGDKIHIEGSLQTRKWQDQSGHDRWTTEIVGDSMEMLGGSGQAGTTGDSNAGAGSGVGPAAAKGHPGGGQTSSGQTSGAGDASAGASGGEASAFGTSSDFDDNDDDVPF